MGKTDYLGSKILQQGKGIKKNFEPYSSGCDPYGQYGGGHTKTTERKRMTITGNPNLDALREMVERAGPDSPDSGIENVVNRAYRQHRNRIYQCLMEIPSQRDRTSLVNGTRY